MTTKFRVARRWSGAAGTPASLLSAELFYNGVDDTLYVGYGDNGSAVATSIKAIGGPGAVVMLTGAQSVAGVKAFSDAPTVPTQAASDNSTKAANMAAVQAAIAAAVTSASIADGDKGDIVVSGSGLFWNIEAGSVTNAKLATVASQTMKGRVSASTGAVEDLSVSQVRTLLSISNVDNTSDAAKPISTATQTALDLKAPLASPAFSGTPTAPTPATSDDSTKLATTAMVQARIAQLLAAAPAALDTLNELAAALGNDPNFATTITASLSEKLVKASNLSDLTNAATARTNLGLGSMATQSAAAVAITGGTIDGVTLDGGTY